MADGEEKKKDEDSPAEGKKSKKKLFIIIGAVLLLLFGGGGFFAWQKFGATDSATPTTDEAVDEGIVGEGSEEELGETSMVELEPFIVNLQDNTGTRYLKLTLQLEIEGAPEEEMQSRTPQIRDSIIILLTSKSYSEVGTIEGKYLLRDEIAARTSQVMGEAKVKGVYFTQFVIQ
ncbi:MAG: flagellar basal body-associated FliL family protein [Deltaproteobacteria bacterium]|nr:flagellar basal body-associated FliL family protein [Deltaproteobacteria bacterium]